MGACGWRGPSRYSGLQHGSTGWSTGWGKLLGRRSIECWLAPNGLIRSSTSMNWRTAFLKDMGEVNDSWEASDSRDQRICSRNTTQGR